MTSQQIVRMMGELKKVFDIVRLVDTAITTQMTVDDEGQVQKSPYSCFSVWHKECRCENCISAKALSTHGKLCKFEFVDKDVYYIIAMYVDINGVPYILEMVTKLDDKTLFSAFGDHSFSDVIENYNERLYKDTLTGVYNRQYYEEQLRVMTGDHAVAMIDVDNFKEINDTYGHEAGDVALRAVAEAISKCVRNTDWVVRYGGDEFVVVFKNMSADYFMQKLERIRQAIYDIVLPGYPYIRLSASIGGTTGSNRTAELIHEADVNMYKAKEKRNSVRIKL